MPRTKPEFRWVTPESLMYPDNYAIVRVLKDHYWVARHTGALVEVLMYGDHPQCSPDRRITEQVLRSAVGRDNGADDILLLPRTFIPIDPRDY